MEGDNSMCERILRTLESIFSSDIDLQEFSVIPTEANTKNKSPVLYEAHNIGLESWCVKHIYSYAYLELMDLRKQLLKKVRPSRHLNHLLIGVLLINPDVSTFWNMKRLLVEMDVLAVSSELLFAKIVLSYKSKSNEAFAYRRWLLNKCLNKTENPDVISTLLQNEICVCTMAASKSPNNYHAWTHRIWCLESMHSKLQNYTEFMNNELQFSHDWVCSHVSEHTGFHYRQYLFNTVKSNRNINTILEFYYGKTMKHLRLVNENHPRSILSFLLGKDKPLTAEQSNNYVNYFTLLLFDLYCTVDILNAVFPNHESIYYHRRYLVYNLVKISYEYLDVGFKTNFNVKDYNLCGENIVNALGSGVTEPKLFKTQPNKVENTFIYKTLLQHEHEFIAQHSSQEYAIDLVRRYETWLKWISNV